MNQHGAKGACAGFEAPSRRAVLRAGALGSFGLALPELFRGRASAGALGSFGPAAGAGSGFGRAKSCILIFQWGGPSQLDTWDPKPDAPEAIRGEFRAIETKIPGVRIGEHFPLLAARADKLAIVRSMTHDDPAHLSTAHRLLTGHLAPTPKSDATPPSARDWPHLGALVGRLRPTPGAIPSAVNMPWTVAHPAAPGGRAPGQHGGWLGKAFDPFRVDGDPNAPGFAVAGLGLPDGVSPDRLGGRRALLAGLGGPGAGAGPAGVGPEAWAGFRGQALDALVSAEARGAFAIERESAADRDRYGRHIHGQCLLLARRLVEAGVGLVTVNWHDDGRNFWDTHGDNFNRLKNDLMPPADRGFAALLDDLGERGLLAETLVVWAGEFGRTPRILNGSGREHWSRCYSVALAGGGVAGGRVFGGSDRWAAYPSHDPVSPDDLGATILHALGIDPGTEINDPLGRPLRINGGNPLTSLFA